MNFPTRHLATLFVKHANSTITTEEQEELHLYLERNPVLQEIYDELQDIGLGRDGFLCQDHACVRTKRKKGRIRKRGL